LDKKERLSQAPVDNFNHELDRILQGGTASEQQFPTEELNALKLALKLARADFSNSSTIRQSLRKKISERSWEKPYSTAQFRYKFMINEWRALAGIGVVLLVAFSILFGLLSPERVPGTPAAYTLPASPGSHELPATSLTAAVSPSHVFYPKPVPTPVAMPLAAGQSTTSPARTPAQDDPSLGSQLPVITTTITK
jgi:hypothetical protein